MLVRKSLLLVVILWNSFCAVYALVHEHCSIIHSNQKYLQRFHTPRISIVRYSSSSLKRKSLNRYSRKMNLFSSVHGVSERKNFYQAENVKDSINLVDVIESYNLPEFRRTSDAKATALCPFHDDNNPSLSIDNRKGIYKCFSCGAGGDVFQFIREYSRVTGGNNEHMTYPEAVRYIAENYLTVEQAAAAAVESSYSQLSEEEMQEVAKRDQKRKRLRLANMAAAEFYGNQLMTNRSAGSARSHLLDRGIGPELVRKYCLGYAPDAFFDKKKSRSDSLVSHLKGLGFSPDEIVESGLASRSKAKVKDKIFLTEGQSKQPEDQGEMIEEKVYDTLIDRFRGRLMVPIFDSSGKTVVGFGGRHLEGNQSLSDKSSEFKVAKYLNSPETDIFQKKNTVFGANIAKKNVSKESPLIVVEGYFDSIALTGIGLESSIAVMGTGISPEQLDEIAKIAGGQYPIVFCLDNDEAGILAMERLCNTSLIFDMISKHRVSDVIVALLPEGIKDPGEYIEREQRETDDVKDLFLSDIVRSATDFGDWYINRLICQNAEQDGSSKLDFSALCEKISSFLSSFKNAADRSRRAFNAAGELSKIVIDEVGGSSKGAEALRIQLESDILDMATRKAIVKEGLTRRLERNGIEEKKQERVVRNLSSGGNVKQDFAQDRSAHGNFKKSVISKEEFDQLKRSNDKTNSGSVKRVWKSNSPGKLQTETSQPIVPHFRGFDFQHLTDKEWVYDGDNWVEKKQPLLLGVRYDSRKKPVYFNSNEAVGGTVGQNDIEHISDDVFFSTGSLKENADEQILAAEDKLLFALVRYSSARMAMKSALAASAGKLNIEWTTSDKKWLFDHLCDNGEIEDEYLPDDIYYGGTPAQLRDFLIALKSAEAGYFEGTEEKRPVAKDFRIDDLLQTIDVSPINKNEESIAVQDDKTSKGDVFEIVNDDDTTAKEGLSSDEVDSKLAYINAYKKFKEYTAQEIDDAVANYDPTSFYEEMENRVAPVEASPPSMKQTPSSQQGQPRKETEINDVEVLLSPEALSEASSNFPDTQHYVGTLDKYFIVNKDDEIDYDMREMKAEFTVQETLSILIRAHALKQHDRAHNQWLASMNSNQIDINDDAQRESLMNLQRARTELVEANATNKRVLEKVKEATSAGGGGMIFAKSVIVEEQLFEEMDRFLKSLPDDSHRSYSDEDYETLIHKDDYEWMDYTPPEPSSDDERLKDYGMPSYDRFSSNPDY